MPSTDSKTSVPPGGAGDSKPASSRAKWWISELISLAIVLAAVTAARSSLADHYYVPSGSMEYSLLPGDRVLVDKTAYGFRIPLTKIDVFGDTTPERGDVAVFDSPRDGTRLIKRIVAIGGDTVSLVEGRLSINGLPQPGIFVSTSVTPAAVMYTAVLPPPPRSTKKLSWSF